jgi:hypothetical protein
MKNLLIKGNLKMGSKVYLFNLPPKITCTPTQWCLHGNNGNPSCYALRNNFNLPSVKKATKQRYKESLKKDFSGKITEEILKNEAIYVRLHSSGDFYSGEYVNKWIKIASSNPKTQFRSTTRRRDLTNIIQELNSLPNVVIRESLDIERSVPQMGLRFAALSDLEIAKNAYKCMDDCELCNYYCWNNDVDVCFDEH